MRLLQAFKSMYFSDVVRTTVASYARFAGPPDDKHTKGRTLRQFADEMSAKSKNPADGSYRPMEQVDRSKVGENTAGAIGAEVTSELSHVTG